MFICMIGLPGSGKSTVAEELKNDKRIVVSSDAIREEWYGSADIQIDSGKVFNEMKKRTFNALKNGFNVIYDATNLSAKRRTNLVKEIRQRFPNEKLIAYMILAPLDVCIYRNLKRDRIVPISAMFDMVKSFQAPYFHEGWDKIYVEYTSDESVSRKTLKEMAKEFDQQSPHHSETLGQHIQLVMKKVREASPDDFLLTTAARFHDFGKMFTQSPLNRRGEIQNFTVNGIERPIMHYYSHDSVSAYLFLTSDLCRYCFYPCDMTKISPGAKDGLFVANLIQFHMEKAKRDEKSYEKFMNGLGSELREKLITLNKCDKEGRVPYKEE